MKITALENGPYQVETGGRVVVNRAGEEEVIEREKIFLCRCGQSSNKPFCDSAHKTCGFSSQVVAFDLPAPAPKPTA